MLAADAAFLSTSLPLPSPPAADSRETLLDDDSRYDKAQSTRHQNARAVSDQGEGEDGRDGTGLHREQGVGAGASASAGTATGVGEVLSERIVAVAVTATGDGILRNDGASEGTR